MTKLSHADKAKAIDRAQESGESLCSVAKDYNIPESTLRSWLRPKPITERRYSVTPIDIKQRAIERVLAGEKVLPVARELLIPESTLRTWIKKKKIEPAAEHKKEPKIEEMNFDTIIADVMSDDPAIEEAPAMVEVECLTHRQFVKLWLEELIKKTVDFTMARGQTEVTAEDVRNAMPIVNASFLHVDE